MKKLTLKAILDHKNDYYEPSTVEVEKVVTLYGDSFKKMSNCLSVPNPYINECKDLMYVDSDNVSHCVLFVDYDSGDGILVNSEGADYARKSQFIPNAKALIMQNDMTSAESQLHSTLKSVTEKIAELSHTGERDFYFGNLLGDIDIKPMIIQTVEEMLKNRADLAEVKAHHLNVPFQPDFTVVPEETEKMKFICPLKIMKESPYETDWDSVYDGNMEEIYQSEAIYYDDVINEKIKNYEDVSEKNRGLMIYYDKDRLGSEKFFSAKPKVEVINGEFMGVFECEVCGEPTEAEINEVRSFLTGQASDGWGEGFEQREIAVSDHDNIYVSFWDSGKDWSMQTDEEFFGQEVKNEPTMSM